MRTETLLRVPVAALILISAVGADAGSPTTPAARAGEPLAELAEVERIYTEARAANKLRIGRADGDPKLLLAEFPRHVEALRGHLRALDSGSAGAGDLSPRLLAWYEAHRLRAIPVVSGDAPAHCEGSPPKPGSKFCDAIEPDVRTVLDDAIERLISSLPSVPRDTRSLGYVPARELGIEGAMEEAILLFEVAAHSENRTGRKGSLHPGSSLDDEEAKPHLDQIRSHLYALAARASYMRFAEEIREPLADVIRAVWTTPALPGGDSNWISIRLRVVQMFVEHWAAWGEC